MLDDCARQVTELLPLCSNLPLMTLASPFGLSFGTCVVRLVTRLQVARSPTYHVLDATHFPSGLIQLLL